MNEVDQYIADYPEKVKVILQNIRVVIKQSAPDAEESIAYGMPAYKTFNRPLIYFAGFKNHIGLYALPSGNTAFKDELTQYKQGKGSVQFPLSKPLPYDLIERIVKFRVKENEEKYGKK